ncbi:AAEL007943-PA [Aedes aegypti]|uniref:AAEL007943-PA n=2 Tax=Aedes aegypti TaxID=7159 RepID=A0A1S4FI65_AEDAE|nr:CWF19-like protein 2 [Aedes aegypti]EAT40318.1 AAEL007943-PA [Aedes aegypti]
MGSSTGSESDSDDRKRHKKHKKKEKKFRKHKKEKKHKKKKSHKKRDRRRSSSGSGSESSSFEGGRDEWVEKVLPQQAEGNRLEREDWMNSMLIPTYSKEPKKDEKKAVAEQYDPKTSVRELNPHWKNGGAGLPNFRKPVEDEDDGYVGKRNFNKEPSGRDSGKSGGWKKTEKHTEETRDGGKGREDTSKQMVSTSNDDGMFLSDQQLNDLGAKIVKAEIMGNTVLANSLKERLEKAKAYRNEIKTAAKPEASAGSSKRKEPDTEEVSFAVSKSADSARHQNKKQRRYQQNLPPGDLADKFRSERFENDNMDAQFFKVSSKLDREANNLDNIFGHSSASTADSGRSNEEKVVRDMNKLCRAQADCERCINSSQFLQDNVISMGESVFLAVPSFRALQPKHCLIVPNGHYPALTHMDEEVYRELIDTCKALKRMFTAHKQEVIFFETVRYINRNPHTYVQCVPADNYEMAPFYFKKAILESETEWAMNKKLHNIQGLEVRRTIPKGLPYFWVNFNLENGFAHVIEDQEEFPVTFASETIGGILGLETRDWRKPSRERNPQQRVKEFMQWWKEYNNLTKA